MLACSLPSPSMRPAASRGVLGRARCPSNNTASHLTLMACALLLATSALAQQNPAKDGGTNASWAPLTVDDLPSYRDCWGLVRAHISEAATGNSADGGGLGSVTLDQSSDDELPYCTVDEADYDRCCKPALFFSMGQPAEGCLCIDEFLAQIGHVLYYQIEGMLGLDLDFYFWADKCAQLGYPVPLSGNDLCPSPRDELQCTSQMTESQLAEADALLQLGAGTAAGSNAASALPTSWSKEANVCCWEGITCNSRGRVENLEVAVNGLTGTLPADFSIMTDLTDMLFQETNLSGSLPPSWSVLTVLRILAIPGQRITGVLPPEYSTLISLKNLNLNDNSLTGTLPEQYSALHIKDLYLDLRGNQLSGTLPSCWSTLTNARRMGFEGNQLSGALPPEWSTMSNMITFRMAKNKKLRGTLPPQWSTFHHINYMVMSDMQLSGPLPSQWSTMTEVEALWLGEHSLTGTLPKEWSTMKALRLMSIKSNLLTGTVPPEWSSLQLSTLYASGNWLVGSIPDCWDDDPDSRLGKGFLDFKVNYVSAAPEGYQDAENMYNCMAGVGGQRMCPMLWRPLLMVAVLILSLVGVLILEAAVKGWGKVLTDIRFTVRRLAKSRAAVFFTRSNMLLLAALTAMCQRLFILSPAFPAAERAFVARTSGVLGVAGSETARLLAGTVCSMLPVVATLLIVAGFVGRAVLVSLPRPDWLPQKLAMQAWTLVASEDILRDNMQTLKIDQLLVLGMFLVCWLAVPLVVSLGLPEVISIREVDPALFWGSNSTVVQLIYLPRTMLGLLAASYIIGIYSMVAVLLIPGAVAWPSVAVNEAIRTTDATSQVQKSLRQLRRLRWAVPQALLSLALCGTCMALFSATEWHEEDGGNESSDLSTVWGGNIEAVVISALVGIQMLCAIGWNLAVWGSKPSCRVTPPAETASADEDAPLSKTASDTVDINGSEDASSCLVTRNSTAWSAASAATPTRESMQRRLGRWLPEVSMVGQTRARDNALLLVTVLQMLHVDGARAGPVVTWVIWLATIAILCWALLVRDAPKGFDDIHECAAFGMLIVASDLAAILKADLAADSDDSSGTPRHRVTPKDEAQTSLEEDCCADYPAGCPRCQLLLRRVPATLYRMQETLCVSYRWQSRVRAVVRPPGHGPVAPAPGLRNRVAGINMTRWQREQLLAAILRSSCTYVWLDVLSIPAALRPQEGTRLGDLSEKLMTRMMAVYSTAACTLALLSSEKEGERYCQRAWTLQEYCGSRELDVVCQSPESNDAALVEKSKSSFRNLISGTSLANQRGQADEAAAFVDEEVARYKELREYVRRSLPKAVPLWIQLLRGRQNAAIDDLDERASLYAKMVDTVKCQHRVDVVRALVPLLLNTSVQTMEELRVLVRMSSRDCPENSDGARAMKRAHTLLGIELDTI